MNAGGASPRRDACWVSLPRIAFDIPPTPDAAGGIALSHDANCVALSHDADCVALFHDADCIALSHDADGVALAVGSERDGEYRLGGGHA